MPDYARSSNGADATLDRRSRPTQPGCRIVYRINRSELQNQRSSAGYRSFGFQHNSIFIPTAGGAYAMRHDKGTAILAWSQVGLTDCVMSSSGACLLLGCFSLRYCHMLPERPRNSHLSAHTRLFPKKLDRTGRFRISFYQCPLPIACRR